MNSPIDKKIFSEELISSENVKNDLNNSSNFCLFLEKPLDEEHNISSREYKSPENMLVSIDKLSDESSFMPNKKIKLNRCKGCYPVFQPNQEGHIGEYGCLEDYYDFIHKT